MALSGFSAWCPSASAPASSRTTPPGKSPCKSRAACRASMDLPTPPMPTICAAAFVSLSAPRSPR